MKSLMFCLAAFLIILSGCAAPQKDHVNTSTPSTAPVAVPSLVVAAQSWPSRQEVSGTVRARTSTTISSRLLATVLSLPVRSGDTVSQGQLLVTLDARDIDISARRAAASRDELRSMIPEAQGAIVAARASLDLASSTNQRMKQLFDKKSISPQEMDESQARLQAAQSALDIANARRGQIDAKLAQVEVELRSTELQRTYTTLHAPFSGTITARHAEAGSTASPGVPLLTLERNDSFQLELALPESMLPVVQRGTRLQVAFDAIALQMDAVVNEIVPSLDSSSRSLTVKVNLPPNHNLRSGLFGRGVFQGPPSSVLAIPPEAIRNQGQLQSVFLVEDGRAKLRIISTGQQRENAIEILSGLSPGERIISPFPAALSEGSPVVTQPGEVK